MVWRVWEMAKVTGIKNGRIILSIVLLAFIFFPFKVQATQSDIVSTIEQIIDWKKGSLGIAKEQPLLSPPLLRQAGTTAGDWYPFALGRSGLLDDYNAYQAIISENVKSRYQTPYQLSENKATEWHRIALAVNATGGDATDVGGHNLIEDGVYNRAKVAPLGKQGLNGLIWGLIALDSLRYKTPANALTDRQQIITEIMSFQQEDGGFGFYQNQSDIDMTAMAIQALAPYYNGTTDVTTAIDAALNYLQKQQQPNGGFSSWSEENAESVAQVIVALTTLGIDPTKDERFKKGTANLVNNLLTFQQPDGGFVHSRKYNEQNPSSLPDESNTMASEQALYSLIALYRLQNNERTLYDMRAPWSSELAEEIKTLNAEIAQVEDMTEAQLSQLYSRYEAIPIAERSYIYQSYRLFQMLDKKNISYTPQDFTEAYQVNEGGKGFIKPLFSTQQQVTALTKQEEEEIKNLLVANSTEHLVAVIAYIYKIEQLPTKQQYQQDYEGLLHQQEKLEALQQHIDTLNEEILQHLYPFTSLTAQDQVRVEKIIKQVEQLTDYDQHKILNYEDVKRAHTQTTTLSRANVIKYSLGIIALLLLLAVGYRYVKRKEV